MVSTKMNLIFVIFVILGVTTNYTYGKLRFEAGAYKGLKVKIDEDVPESKCKVILLNLEATLTSASNYLNTALNGRAYFSNIEIILPNSWSEGCTLGYNNKVSRSTGGPSDITIYRGTNRNPKKEIWTQRSASGCGPEAAGDRINIDYDLLNSKNEAVARKFVKSFAEYRYGVWSEEGVQGSQIHPLCFHDDAKKEIKVTGCSDFPIIDNGICSRNPTENASFIVDNRARTSIMFSPESKSISLFCDDGNHDKFAPTPHNSFCGGRSTLSVILEHPDFKYTNTKEAQNEMEENELTTMDSIDENNSSSQAQPSFNHIMMRPTFTYTKESLTRYVVILEDSRDMLIRESWSFLRSAIRKWAVYDLPKNTEVGLVLTNDTNSAIVLNLTSLMDHRARDIIASSIPYSPSDSTGPSCLQCAILKGTEMLEERTRQQGPASSVILIISTGMDYSVNVTQITERNVQSDIKIASINYPAIRRSRPLDALAENTDGIAFTVFESKCNLDTSLLTTYFKLTSILYAIAEKFYQGNRLEFPVEIHRREITDDSRASVTGSFVISTGLGEPSRFSIFTHQTDMPLVKDIKLTSPSELVYKAKSDAALNVKMLLLPANINETGTWTYSIDRYTGNPQPHFVQVLTTESSAELAINARFWVRRINPKDSNVPLYVLHAEIRRGSDSVLGARVNVVVTRNFPAPQEGTDPNVKDRFEMLDVGGGDPDVAKDDGIYSRYYIIGTAGAGTYTFETTVSDNGNHAYTKRTQGSETLPPFQRVLPPVSITLSQDEIPQSNTLSSISVGRIGDLQSQVLSGPEPKARLIWTAPDMGGLSVQRYEIKYATSVEDIVDKYETAAVLLDNAHPFPLAPGSETTFTLDLEQDLLDKPLYYAIRAYSALTSNAKPGPVSNWARVYVPSPPPSTTIPAVRAAVPSWFEKDEIEPEIDRPQIAKRLDFGIELILPIVGGALLLAVLLAIYCYFCVLRRRHNGHVTKKSDKLTPGIQIVTTSNTNSPMHNYTQNDFLSEHHTVGLPLNYSIEDEPKKRYSVVPPQEQQLIEELKQQQREFMNNTPLNGVSVISSNGRILSPYESWSASQLLHEHERRHSPVQMQESGAPPVPPLPIYSGTNGPPNLGYNNMQPGYSIYGTHPGHYAQQPQLVPFNPSLQGSLNSVNSGEKKRRNVTMV